jgi:hypothetical protein
MPGVFFDKKEEVVNKINFRMISIFMMMTFVLILGNSYNVGAAYGEQFSQSQTALPAFPGAEGFGANKISRWGGTVDEITNTNDGSHTKVITAIPASIASPAPVSGLTRPIKYYGVDRGSPFTDANYATLAQHAVKTIIVDTFINDANNSSSAKWSNIKALAAKYNFNYVIWPNQGGDVPGCGWETPFNSPKNGDYIWRVTTMLDSFAIDPHFIGMISAHEPMWNTSTCKTSINDMASIKTQLKNYMQIKGRTDFKVWNYIDNVSDLRDMPGFINADIERVMDVAVTWQHCFGGAEGTCSGAKNKIIKIDKINKAKKVVKDTKDEELNIYSEENLPQFLSTKVVDFRVVLRQENQQLLIHLAMLA